MINFKLNPTKLESDSNDLTLFDVNYDQIAVDLSKTDEILGDSYPNICDFILYTNEERKRIFEQAFQILHIKDDNIKLFLNIISYNEVTLYCNNLYDIFKLAEYFSINSLLEDLQNFCKNVYDINDLLLILQNGKISTDDEDNFIKFLIFSQFQAKLSPKINEIFYLIDDFPIKAVYYILKNCESIDLIDANKLYYLIMQSIERNFCLLPFLNFYKLDKYSQDELGKKLKKFMTKINTLQSQKSIQNDSNYKLSSNSSSTKTFQDEIRTDSSSSLKIKNLEKQIESLTNENKQLKEKIDSICSSSLIKFQGLEQQIQSLKQENEELKEKIKQYEANNASSSLIKFQGLEQQIRSLKQENKQLKEEIKQIEINNDMQSSSFKENEQFKEKVKQMTSGAPASKNIIYPNLTNTDSDLQHYINQSKKEYNSAPSSSNTSPIQSPPKAAPHLTQKNYDRIEIFNQNRKIVKKGSYTTKPFDKFNYIKLDVSFSIKNTEVISSGRNLQYVQKRRKCNSHEKSNLFYKMEVTRESTFGAAIRMTRAGHINVCVLNFASSTKPGGGVLNGRNAQEESLARQSTLYFSLVEQKGFYEHNNKHYDSYGTDYMIYSPKVIILRDDNDKLIDPVKVSVISAVAVNCSELQYPNEPRIRQIMKGRCKRILDLCLSKGNDVIVLGAFGCGVFKNSPKMISDIFKELLIDEFYAMEFAKVIFAIKTKPNKPDELYSIFHSRLTHY